MKRNRSIRALPLDNLTLFRHPPPDSLHNDRLYFGEEVTQESEKTQVLSSDDSDVILASVRDWGSKSSSSSLSWGEEYKSEASKQVKEELERMDRVLRGEEPIPSHYDQEEYQEWMQFFPNLCVLGTKTGVYVNSVESTNDFEETLAIHPEDTCDKKVETSDRIKKAVIDQIYDKIVTKAPKITLNDSIDLDKYLKISPIGGARLPRRQLSSRSLMSSQISSSKWLKEDDYSSLPFVSVRNGRAPPKSILKNSLVLPPIESRSALSSKSMSALSRRK
ncbi:uncharacterized protein LOC657163 [Tribolium castaneum]|uniref:Uncharacterized protein n=1 Tax=Tribolium castaneum TaxID=7070 RepID=D6X3R5_TRICA|nr:PREDICTED: uncharacterized protein LOC657163 [Tribolium castaneum]EEZ97383.1 hypothetical protein TcasGA2_TC011208 [Tribolium castaneum]|eukprot:XP_976234.1 PREDICTED: uncharacterized protein LOC657163 [Tribolium castaneum]